MQIAISVLTLLIVSPVIAESIPITTTSPLALQKYLEGRSLFEKLRGQDA